MVLLSLGRRRTKSLILCLVFLFALVTWRYAISFSSCDRPMHCWDVRKYYFSSWMQPRGREAGGLLIMRKSRESRMRWPSQEERATTIGRRCRALNMMVESKEDDWLKDIEKETGGGTLLKHLVVQAGPAKVQKLTMYSIPVAGAIGLMAGIPRGAMVSLLGAGLGSALGTVMRTRLLEECKTGAPLSLAKLIVERGVLKMTDSEVQTVLDPYSLTDNEKMGVARSLYSRYLLSMCSHIEMKASELRELQSLCEVLGLEGPSLGEAHYDACSRLYKDKILFAPQDELIDDSNINRRFISKFLFLTWRTLNIQDTEEAAMYEMARIRKLLDIPEDEQAYRINEVSRPLYEKAVATALSKLGSVSATALKKAAETLGLPDANAQAVHFNIIYQEVSRVVKGMDSSGDGHHGRRNQLLRISPESKERLKQLAQLFSIPFSQVESALQKYTVPVFEEKMKEELGVLIDVIERGRDVAKAAVHFQQVMAAMSVNLGLPGGRTEAELEQMFTERSMELFMFAFQMSKVGAVDQMIQATHKALKFVSSLLPVIEDQIGVKKGEGFQILGKEGDSILKGSGATRAERVKMLEQYTKGIDDEARPNELKHHQDTTNLLARLLGISETEVNEIKSKTVGPQLTESIELAIMSEEFTEDSKTRLLDLKLQLDIPDKLYEEACKDVYIRHVHNYVEENKNRKAILSPSHAKTLAGIAGLFDLLPTFVSNIHRKEFGEVFEQCVLESFETPGGLRDPTIKNALPHLKERLSFSSEDAAEMVASASKKKLAPLVSRILHDFDKTTVDDKKRLPVVKDTNTADTGEDYFSHGGAASENLGIETSAADKAVSMDILDMIDFYERNGLMDLSPNGNNNITVNVTIGDIVNGEENLKKLYTHFLAQSFAAPHYLAQSFESAQPKLAAILGLSPEVTTNIASEMAATLVRKFIHENMKAEPPRPLGDHEHKMLAQLRLKLGLAEEDFQALLSRTTKGIIAMIAERARSSGELSRSARRLRVLSTTYGVDMELDLGMTLNQRKNLLEAEIKEAVENIESETIERDELLEIAEELSLPPGDAAECVEKVVMEGSAHMLVSAGMDVIRGIESRAISAIESLLRYLYLTGEGVEVDTGIDVAPTQKLAVYNLYKNTKLHSKLSTTEIKKVNNDLQLLMKALALEMETSPGF